MVRRGRVNASARTRARVVGIGATRHFFISAYQTSWRRFSSGMTFLNCAAHWRIKHRALAPRKQNALVRRTYGVAARLSAGVYRRCLRVVRDAHQLRAHVLCVAFAACGAP
jgi:hypothetical protein